MTGAPRRTAVCFGDSNTYGTPAMPSLDAWGRFAPHDRWPGVLAAALGDTWQVIEEGLPARTTVHDDPIEGRDKNGLSALPMILGSHRPIDLLIIKLGTNDLKARFAVTAEDIAASVGLLVTTTLASVAGPESRAPAVLVIAPPPIQEAGCLAGYFQGGASKSQALGAAMGAMAERWGVPFLDAGRHIAVDPVDGIHLAIDQHAVLGRAVAARMAEAGI